MKKETQETTACRVELDVEGPFWDRFYSVAPLVIVGTRELTGRYNFAPKHMATPLGHEKYFGFVCTPRHSTYHNAARDGAFTVSYPKPDQIVLASLTASPRSDDDVKHSLEALPTTAAMKVDGALLENAYLQLECTLDRIIDGFGPDSLIVGQVVCARVDSDYLRSLDSDDRDLLLRSPVLAYLPPGRFATLSDTHSFPFADGFRR